MKNIFYRINGPIIVDEIFDDEIIVINFDNGNYFSLRQSSIPIWKGIKEGLGTVSILIDLEREYILSSEVAEETILEVINMFLAEGLISKNDIIKEENSTVAGKVFSEKIPFEVPLIEKFTDMNDLLLLDPVHDVDEKGWPHVNTDTSNG